MVSARVGKEISYRGSLSVASIVGLFLAVSSSMLVLNKLAVRDLPFPNIILLMQVLSCSAFVAVAHAIGFVELAGIRRWQVVGPFAIYSLAFVAGLFANLKARCRLCSLRTSPCSALATAGPPLSRPAARIGPPTLSTRPSCPPRF